IPSAHLHTTMNFNVAMLHLTIAMLSDVAFATFSSNSSLVKQAQTRMVNDVDVPLKRYARETDDSSEENESSEDKNEYSIGYTILGSVMLATLFVMALC